MHPLVINDSTSLSHHPYYQQPQHYASKTATPSPYIQHQNPLDTVRSSYHHHYTQQSSQISTPQPRRASMAAPVTLTTRQRSNPNPKSPRDRRRSSGNISTISSQQQQHKSRKCIGNYYVGKTLGKGASGRVKLGTHKHTGKQVAIKIISKAHLAANPAIEKAVRREIAIMKLIRHPNVMALVDVIDDSSSSDINLVLEYVQGGELFEYLVSKGRLSDAEARRHFQQIILGLDFCHHHLICHRDLKPENLLLDSTNNIKIADFGMASLQPTGSMLETSCGSPHYASPEIVAGLPYNGSASDIWSCGVILYALLTGHLPFDDENIRQLLRKVKSGKYAMPDDISENAQDLLRRILVVDPSERLTMDQIMAHPWFCQSDPVNLAALPVPPTENEIGRPVSDPSEIDDRILETIKFLWGETQDEAVIHALISKEHNMQKVVYVLLQQQAERYWQNEHDDENNQDTDRGYHTLGRRTQRNRRCMSLVMDDDAKLQLSGPRPSLPWIPEPVACASSTRPSSHANPSSTSIATPSTPEFMHTPPLTPSPLVTMKYDNKPQIKKSDTFYSRFVKNVLPSRRASKQSQDSSVQSNFDTAQHTNPSDGDPTGNSFSTIKSNFTVTLRRKNPFGKTAQHDIGDDINLNQEQLDAKADEQPVPPSVPTKSTLRRFSVSRNKVDPKTQSAALPPASVSPDPTANSFTPPENATTTRLHNGKSVNPKRLSIRVPNAFRTDSGTNRFSFTVNGTRRQRKELDLSVFRNQHSPMDPASSEVSLGSDLKPPPPLSGNSTITESSDSNISSDSDHYHPHQQYRTNNDSYDSNNNVHSSSSTSSTSSSADTPITPSTTAHQQASQFKSALRSSPGKGEFLHSPPPSANTSSSSSTFAGDSRRGSQASLQSVSDRRGSNISSMLNRPITPSLLSNSSTMTTSDGSCLYSPSYALGSPVTPTMGGMESNGGKPSWLSNLFFFKQPKVCSVLIPETDVGTILCTLDRLINQNVEAKFYEKEDKQGIKRYKVEIKTQHLGKLRQVKCRLEIMPLTLRKGTDAIRKVQFIQQQGDGITLASVVRHLQDLLEHEYPITTGF